MAPITCCRFAVCFEHQRTFSEFLKRRIAVTAVDGVRRYLVRSGTPVKKSEGWVVRRSSCPAGRRFRGGVSCPLAGCEHGCGGGFRYGGLLVGAATAAAEKGGGPGAGGIVAQEKDGPGMGSVAPLEKDGGPGSGT